MENNVHPVIEGQQTVCCMLYVCMYVRYASALLYEDVSVHVCERQIFLRQTNLFCTQ